MISSFPVLFVAFLEKFQRSRSETSIIGSLQVGLLYMLTAVPGYFVPIFGLKLMLFFGCIITATGFISSMFVTEIHFLYFTMGVITSLGASIVADSAPLITFKKWRSLSTIVSGIFGSLGFAVIPFTMSYLIQTYALSGALLVFAGIILQVLVLAMLFPSGKNALLYINEKKQQRVDDEEYDKNPQVKVTRRKFTSLQKYSRILKNPSFWCLTGAALTIDSLSNGCRVFLLDKAMVQGLEESKALMAISLWGIFSATSKILLQAPFINKSPKRRQIALVITNFCWSLVTINSIVFKSYKGFLSYCILAGVFHGMNSMLWYLVLADIMERELVVTAYSLQCMIAGPFVTFGVPIAGMIYDKTQSYDMPYLIYGCFGICGTICEAFIPYFERRKSNKDSKDSTMNVAENGSQ